MIFTETFLSGAYIVDAQPFQDERGLFARTFCAREFAQIGHVKPFVQMNHSVNHRAGTLRGMHYQVPPSAEIKLIRCVRGRALDVIVDLRHGSPTFLQHVGVELSEENLRLIYVPEGFAHGFLTLEDNTQLIYHHTQYYAPTDERGLRHDDPRLAIAWPRPAAVLNPKDQQYALLTADFAGVGLPPTGTTSLTNRLPPAP